jgi:tetratricopeptide (TPR) repeat protein
MSRWRDIYKTTAVWTLTLLISFSSIATGREHAQPLNLTRAGRVEAPPQSVHPPQRNGRDEYNALKAMVGEGDDPLKAISLAEAFLLMFPKSDFKVDAYLAEMWALYRLKGIDQAVEAARRALSVDRDNLDALAFLSYVFCFSFKAVDREARSNLSRAGRDAQHGLDVLANLQKPDNLTSRQFNAAVTPYRAVFNIAVGFVVLQRKNCGGAIPVLKAAAADVHRDYYPYQQPWLVPPAARGSSLIDPGELACLLNPSLQNSFFCRENRRSTSLGVVPDDSADLASAESDTPEQEQASAPPPPHEPCDQLVEQLNDLTAEVDTLRREQATREAHPGFYARPGPQPPGAVLIYQDGRQLEVQNYAILGKTLWVFSDQASRRIPLADLDLPATRKFNESRGINFELLDQQ